jgi:protein-S-isoprenylcysteine O-methyltransferase Ste14
VTTPHSASTLVRAFQVAGALLFFISLAIGGRAYVQQFDAVAAADASPWLPLLTNVALFAIFALHHSVLARTPIKAWLRARVGVDTERALYVTLASVLFLACTQLWVPLPGTWYRLAGLWWWVGSGVQAAGVAVTLLAARTLSLRELMGLERPRQAAHPDDAPVLETRGLYRLVRHPIYFGWLLMVAGAPLMTSTRLLFATISVAYLIIAIPLEERSLVENFGGQYRAYQRQVRWRMVPGLY